MTFPFSNNLLLIFASLVTISNAWTFSAVENGQCGPMTVTWSGGKGPFHVTIHPIAASSSTITIPDSAVSSGQGSIEIVSQVPAGHQFVVSMGDADGLLTGGTSPVLTSSPPRPETSDCGADFITPSFFWSANGEDNIQQCQTYAFTEVGTAPSTASTFQRPTSLLVLIPGSDKSFTVQMPDAPSFAWIANIKSGTQVVFDMVDSAGNQGGVGPLYTVQSGSESCTLHDSNDKSTSTASPDATSSAQSSAGTGFSLSRGVLIGVIIGGLAVVALIGLLIFLLLRKRNRDRENRKYADKPLNLLSYPDGVGYSDDFDPPRSAAQSQFFDGSRNSHHHAAANRQSQYSDGSQNQIFNPWGSEPYDTTAASSSSGAFSSSAAPSTTYLRATSPAASTFPPMPQTTAYPTKARLAQQQQPLRVIQHADIADNDDTPDDPAQPVELPPSYSDTRPPLSQFAEIGSGGGQSSQQGASVSSSSTHPSASDSSGRRNSMRKGPR